MKKKEECGVFGILKKEEVLLGDKLYRGLYAIQHRGQESSGIAFFHMENIKVFKSMGLVPELFSIKDVSNIKSNMAIGHVRYSTTGNSSIENAQPLIKKFSFGEAALCHNGNLINTKALKECFLAEGEKFNTSSDSELLLKFLGRELQFNLKELNLEEALKKSVTKMFKEIKGAYSFIFMIKDALVGVRDPLGIRPLSIGKIEDGYIIASESCAVQSAGGEFIRNVEPGEMVLINKEGIFSFKLKDNKKRATCAFEYVYFSREDSFLDGISVYNSRVEAGKRLYEESQVEADIVIGVPDSGIPAAIGYSRASGIPYTLGFARNKYAGRSFIMPSEDLRDQTVKVKINPLIDEIKGKKIILVDDSIVRGVSMKNIVKSLIDFGAKEVHCRIASPPIRHCCFLGIDTSSEKELIANLKDINSLKKYIGAHSLCYLSEQEFVDIFPQKHSLCLGCFNGIYPV